MRPEGRVDRRDRHADPVFGRFGREAVLRADQAHPAGLPLADQLDLDGLLAQRQQDPPGLVDARRTVLAQAQEDVVDLQAGLLRQAPGLIPTTSTPGPRDGELAPDDSSIGESVSPKFASRGSQLDAQAEAA